jgi:hypothetical protein
LPYIARQIVSPQTKLHFDEERVAIVTDDAAQRRRLCKFVAGGPAPIAQRRASAFASFGRQHRFARYDWLTKLRAEDRVDPGIRY